MSKGKRPIDDIAPDGFLDAYPGDTIDECLAFAHRQAPSTTPASDTPLCPACGSQRVRRRNAHTNEDQLQKDPDPDWRCTNCREFFDDPEYRGFDLPRRVEDDFEYVDPDDLAEPPFTRQLAQLDDDVLAALAIYCYAPWWPGTGLAATEIAEVFPYGSHWIGDRVREWRDGAYRDLVADPQPQIDSDPERAATALVLFCARPWRKEGGPSYPDLAGVLPYSRSWIGERVRAWRDGEFRDLVADPRPWRVDDV